MLQLAGLLISNSLNVGDRKAPAQAPVLAPARSQVLLAAHLHHYRRRVHPNQRQLLKSA